MIPNVRGARAALSVLRSYCPCLIQLGVCEPALAADERVHRARSRSDPDHVVAMWVKFLFAIGVGSVLSAPASAVVGVSLHVLDVSEQVVIVPSGAR